MSDPSPTTFRMPSVSAEAMLSMALLHRDGNPIHIDRAAAAAQGLGDKVVNPGSSNLGFILNALLSMDPDAQIERIEVAFRSNVVEEDDAIASATVRETEDDGDRRRLTCDVSLDVQGGTTAMDGTAVVSVPGGPR